jgi:hypothetical protein
MVLMLARDSDTQISTFCAKSRHERSGKERYDEWKMEATASRLKLKELDAATYKSKTKGMLKLSSPIKQV